MGSVPRSSHAGAGTLGFADGHAELRKWMDPITLLPVRQMKFFLLWRALHKRNYAEVRVMRSSGAGQRWRR
jgi:prepilin-type processing-associated H-X9-DG protein